MKEKKREYLNSSLLLQQDFVCGVAVIPAAFLTTGDHAFSLFAPHLEENLETSGYSTKSWGFVEWCKAGFMLFERWSSDPSESSPLYRQASGRVRRGAHLFRLPAQSSPQQRRLSISHLCYFVNSHHCLCLFLSNMSSTLLPESSS